MNLNKSANTSFSMDKWSGSKCWMIGARSLCIEHSDSPACWQWTSIPESRSSSARERRAEYIRGKIQTSTLTSGTNYAAYLVYKMTENAKGLHTVCKASVFPPGGKAEMRLVYLSLIGALRLPAIADRLDQGPKLRSNGWQEVKIGEFFTHIGEEGRAWFYVDMKDGSRMSGLVIQGIESNPLYHQKLSPKLNPLPCQTQTRAALSLESRLSDQRFRRGKRVSTCRP
ncbi:hypothetical protein V2J09_007774 [Rumex salicifolius]